MRKSFNNTNENKDFFIEQNSYQGCFPSVFLAFDEELNSYPTNYKTLFGSDDGNKDVE